jgi:hypothetical protein
MKATKHVGDSLGRYVPQTEENVSKIDEARKAAYEDML